MSDHKQHPFTIQKPKLPVKVRAAIRKAGIKKHA